MARTKRKQKNKRRPLMVDLSRPPVNSYFKAVQSETGWQCPFCDTELDLIGRYNSADDRLQAQFFYCPGCYFGGMEH